MIFAGNKLYRLEQSCTRIISLCNSLSLKEGVCVHSPIIKLGFHDDMYMSNNLLSLYAKCFGLKQARNLFDEMPQRDIISWTGMQSAYVKNRNHSEALQLFGSMLDSEQNPNEFTLSCVLRSCSALGNLDLGACIHGYMLKAGFESKPILGSTLIDFYAKSDCHEEAYRYFMSMDNGDTVSWTTMISSLVQARKWREALQLYISMIQNEVFPNEFTFVKLLATASFIGLKYGKLLHTHLIIMGINLNVVMKTALVEMYMDYSMLEDAIKVSNQTPEYDVFLWTSIISGFTKNSKVREAISALNAMKLSQIEPNNFTYSSILSGCTAISALKLGQQIHLHVILAGLEADICVGSALIDMYMKSSNLTEDGLRVFNKITEPNVICWTSLISGLAEHGFEEDCIKLFYEMQAKGVQPNSFTLSTILRTCKSPSQALKFHGHIMKSSGVNKDIVVLNALIDSYARLEMMDCAQKVITTMSCRDAITYTTLATRMNQMGHHETALNIFMDMSNDDIKMDGFSLASFLSASANLGTLETGKQLHSHSLKSGLDSYISVRNSLVDLYGKFGCMNDAYRAFWEIAEPGVFSWNGLISSLAVNGYISSALSAFDDMRLAGFGPDSVTFQLVLFACSQVGLVDLGYEYFKSMREVYDITPELDHYVCLVDLLGRADRLEEAVEVVGCMPFKANALMYKTLLGACKLHGNMLLGEDMARRGIELDPSDPSFYAMLANLYDESGRSDLSEKTRKLMAERGLRKNNPSESWIEIRNNVHVFINGDRSHLYMEEIQGKLRSLIARFKSMGYLYSENGNSSYHCEKLAVAFGLVTTVWRAPIRVMKNIRICRECHEFMILATKVEDREIIVRDPNRLHVFKNGQCSCGARL